MQSDPKVSVIISAYGAEDYIEECISSVASQSYFQENNFEILVGIDGCCSTLDKMMKIKDQRKILYMRELAVFYRRRKRRRRRRSEVVYYLIRS